MSSDDEELESDTFYISSLRLPVHRHELKIDREILTLYLVLFATLLNFSFGSCIVIVAVV